MAESIQPRKPVSDWQEKRQQWLDRVQEVTEQVRSWSKQKGWDVLEGSRRIEEDAIGPYEVPRLIIETPTGRLYFEPVARYLVGTGTKGRFDLYAFPTLNKVLLIDQEDGLHWYSEDRVELGKPWSREALAEMAESLSAEAA